MSYDVWLEIATGAAEPVCVVEVGNYTSTGCLCHCHDRQETSQ